MQIAVCFFFLLTFLLPLQALALKKETVILHVGEKGNVRVQVDFEMEGRVDRKFGMAFPETEAFELNYFKVLWNQKPVMVYKKYAGKNHQFTIGTLELPAIFKFSVPISKGTKHKLKTSYSYTALSMNGTKSPRGLYLEYVLQTGSKWDHKIGEVVFIIRGQNRLCEKIYVLQDSYKGECNDKGEYAVRLTNIEPEKDFRYILTE